MPALRASVTSRQGDGAYALNDADRNFAEALRERMGSGYSDAQILATMQRAREAGFRGPQAIEASCMQAGTFFMRGDHTAGYATIRMGLNEVVSTQDEPYAVRVATQVQREQALDAQWERLRTLRMG